MLDITVLSLPLAAVLFIFIIFGVILGAIEDQLFKLFGKREPPPPDMAKRLDAILARVGIPPGPLRRS